MGSFLTSFSRGPSVLLQSTLIPPPVVFHHPCQDLAYGGSPHIGGCSLLSSALLELTHTS